MAAPLARARVDYDYIIKLLLIGDSGVGKSCLLVRFYDGSFTNSFITTIGMDLKIRTIKINGKQIELEIRDVPGREEGFSTITTECYRGAMGILLVYDVTDESSFNNIRKWISNIEQHAPGKVMKILIGNKADMDESKRVVPTSKGKELANEYGIEFFETSAKTDFNVEEVFFSATRGVMKRLDTDISSEASQLPSLFKKAIDVSTMGVEAAMIILLKRGAEKKLYSFGHPDFDSIVELFLRAKENPAEPIELHQKKRNEEFERKNSKKRKCSDSGVSSEGKEVCWWEKSFETMKTKELKEYANALKKLMEQVSSVLESKLDETRA